jgi:hypothetical protein
MEGKETESPLSPDMDKLMADGEAPALDATDFSLTDK